MAASHTKSSTILFSILMIMILPRSTNSISFDFQSFQPNGQRLFLENDSSVANNVIELTRNRINDNLQSSVGRATYPDAILLWDSSTGKVTDFETHFSFIMKGLSNTSYGDGITFFLAPNDSRVPRLSTGGHLGLLSQDKALINTTDNKIVAVEFDSFWNEWDPSADHVGINVNSVVSVANVSWKSSIKDGRRANAWVSYNSTAKNLSVFLSYADAPVFSGNSSLFHVVDLSEFLPEWIRVGFSASTGTSVEIHNILSWQFNSTLELANVTTQIAKAPTNGTVNPTNGMTEKPKSSKAGLVVGLVVGIGVLGCAVGCALFIRSKKRSSSHFEDDAANSDMSMDDEFEKGTGPKKFSYNELVNATNDFVEGGKLGVGGFGGVYKGLLSNGTYVAVKRVSKESHQGKKEYQSEVRIISRLRHRNLVQLIGWCHERKELLLVYEFMPNQSLDKHLFGAKIVLTWAVRYKIALGIASALLYLHEEWEQCVVHRDIKSSNVMLDSNFNAKLGDFGLARLVDHDLGSQTTVLAGTPGYLAPECFATGKSSKESDIYSFGIVALEIACGKRPVQADRKVLVEQVWELYGNGRIIEAADERLSMDFDEQQMQHLMVIGLWCAHPDYTARPSIRQVINILNLESPLPSLPSKLPTPVYLSPPIKMCKHFYGDSTSSQTDGSQCTCSSCTYTGSSRMTASSSASSSTALSLLHSR